MKTNDYEGLLASISDNLSALEPGTVFFVKGLFVGTDWLALSRGDKLGFGRYFKRQVAMGSVSNVEYVGKADNNSAQYRIIDNRLGEEYANGGETESGTNEDL